jgi:phosphate/sulfate permease
MTTASSIIAGIVALVKAIPIIDGWVQIFISSYIDKQSQETKSKISDAAAMSARAKTDEERYAAAALWIDALGRSRIS